MALGLCFWGGTTGYSDAEPRRKPKPKLTYPVVDTGQDRCYDTRREIPCPPPGKDFFGQDAQYVGSTPVYRDNGDGTVTDLVTGLMWQKTPPRRKFTQADAQRYAKNLTLAGYNDWRVPTIKELFSLADFRGNMHIRRPYIDIRFFDFWYPPATGNMPGTRAIDAQYASSTPYVGITMGRDRSAFGFNFADGRLKAYPLRARRYIRCVRGNPLYGKNRFHDNGDGTITDFATGLTWQKADSGKPMEWKEALKYAETLKLGGCDDWRLPNVKELQSIVDYSSAPDALDPQKRGPAIDPIFELTEAESWFWASTTHVETGFAYYVCFGQAYSAMRFRGKKINAHGAGAVRSAPKQGPNRWPHGLGPQRDEVRTENFVRCVRCGARLVVCPTARRRGP